MNRMELLDGLVELEYVVEDSFEDIDDNIDDNNEVIELPLLNCASNLPACGGPIYSNTYWLPEDTESLLDDIIE